MSTVRCIQASESSTKLNNDLYALMQTTKVDMDYDLFCVLIDLLRTGVSPETLFGFLSTIIPFTKVGKKLSQKRRKQKIAKENRKEKECSSFPVSSAFSEKQV